MRPREREDIAERTLQGCHPPCIGGTERPVSVLELTKKNEVDGRERERERENERERNRKRERERELSLA